MRKTKYVYAMYDNNSGELSVFGPYNDKIDAEADFYADVAGIERPSMDTNAARAVINDGWEKTGHYVEYPDNKTTHFLRTIWE